MESYKPLQGVVFRWLLRTSYLRNEHRLWSKNFLILPSWGTPPWGVPSACRPSSLAVNWSDAHNSQCRCSVLKSAICEQSSVAKILLGIPKLLALGHLGLILDVEVVALVGDPDLVGHHHPDVPLFILPFLFNPSTCCNTWPSPNLSSLCQPLVKIDNP